MNLKSIIGIIYDFGVIAELFWKMIFLVVSLYFLSTIMREAGRWGLGIELIISILTTLYLFKIIFDFFIKTKWSC